MEKEIKKTTNETFEAKPPEYAGDGVAVWINKDKNGNNYLVIKIVGHLKLTAFANIKKET